ncbi:hypothetical protein QBC46DRAFT_341522 [Diplogelasinospora grovesii]|uniref:J domain-containing protein n=1 Tax=Diplogelasinospora grovesii TaxID=303347 RepID=A0AAN6S559_9PEZI|nr:hypothetical protein QBC46DRAFT_341522 [Diplogelasinospora grovesii]
MASSSPPRSPPPPPQPKFRDYYADLSLSAGSNASNKDIRKAYCELAKQFHPDKKAPGQTIDAAEFRSVCEAYEFLSSPAKRELYDPQWRAYKLEQAAAEARRRRAEEAARREREALEINSSLPELRENQQRALEETARKKRFREEIIRMTEKAVARQAEQAEQARLQAELDRMRRESEEVERAKRVKEEEEEEEEEHRDAAEKTRREARKAEEREEHATKEAAKRATAGENWKAREEEERKAKKDAGQERAREDKLRLWGLRQMLVWSLVVWMVCHVLLVLLVSAAVEVYRWVAGFLGIAVIVVWLGWIVPCHKHN